MKLFQKATLALVLAAGTAALSTVEIKASRPYKALKAAQRNRATSRRNSARRTLSRRRFSRIRSKMTTDSLTE